ncbi:hypothetical protein [Nocardia fluminea]|uniref:Uncharacterized protein n=1 Tax=Nocardia fluminea TaxID=134984 RepID=A0A2N3V9I6_9NOCA|nr:hypothetical protein [Nocardia fluminea]PKV78300.1 hypothetical protein ATK86_2663 [Nocardia fluminea]
MALKDMWIPTDFAAVFPQGLMLVGAIEADEEFSSDRNAPKRQKIDMDREGNGSRKRMWKATVMDPAGAGKGAKNTGLDITFIADVMPSPPADEVAPGFRPIVLEGLMLKPRVTGNGEFKSIGFYIRATGIKGDKSGARVNNLAADKAA